MSLIILRVPSQGFSHHFSYEIKQLAELPGAVDGKSGHHGLLYRRRRIRILCSSDFFVDLSVGEKKKGSYRPWFFWNWVLLGKDWDILGNRPWFS